MEEKDLAQLKDLKDDIEEILSLDVNYLREKMKEDPDEILVTMRAGFLVLYSILESAVNSVDQ